MENLKIRVTTKQESKEAQELFFELGFGWHAKGKVVSYSDKILSDYFGWLVLRKPSYLTKTVIQMGGGFEDCKEITLPQLRDMVVLNRNDPKDATHTDQDNWKWYIGADSYVWQVGNSQQLKQWDQSSLTMVVLKPIKKEWQRESLNDKVASAEEYKKSVQQGISEAENGYLIQHSDVKKIMKDKIDKLKHSHYKKDVSHLKSIDVYRVLDLFNVEGHEVGHAIKKLLCSGQRGAKDHKQDIQEAIDSLNRHLEMLAEDEAS